MENEIDFKKLDEFLVNFYSEDELKNLHFYKVKDLGFTKKGRKLNLYQNELNDSEGYPVYSSKTLNDGILGYLPTYDYDMEAITWNIVGDAGTVFYRNGKFTINDNCGLLTITSDKVLPKFLYYALKIKSKKYVNHDSTLSMMNCKNVDEIVVPIPPISAQKRVIAFLDTMSALITALRTEKHKREEQYKFFLFDFIYMNKKYLNILFDQNELNQTTYTTLGDIGNVYMCKRVLKQDTLSEGDIPFYKIGTFGSEPDAYISRNLFNKLKNTYSYPEKGDILLSASGTIGKCIEFSGDDSYFQDSNIVWLKVDKDRILNKYLYFFYKTFPWHLEKGGTIQRLYNRNILETIILLPPLSVQKRIVEILDLLEKEIYSISAGLPAEIRLREQQYQYYLNKLLSFED